MKNFYFLLLLGFLFLNIETQAQEYNFQNTVYFYKLPNDSLISSGLTLGQYNYWSANASDSIFHDGIYFPANDCFGHNLWIRLRHIAADPNGNSVGINVQQTTGNPCQSSIMIGGWAGFLYDFEIHRDINLTGTRGNYLDALFPTSITVASLEWMSGTCGSSEWVCFSILNGGSTGWNLNSINFTGNNPYSNPAFSDTLAVYTTGGCFPPDGFTYTFPTGADSISFINGSSIAYSEFKMSAGIVSHVTYGYEYYGGSGGYQGMSMAFGSAPTFSATSSDVSCLNGNDGVITVNVSGGIGPFTYQWNDSTATGNSLTGLSSGTYHLTVTDQNGCGTLADTVLVINDPANVTVGIDSSIVSDVQCFGGSDGSIQQFANGTGTLTYNWSSGATTNPANNLVAGNYVCTVSDQNSCIVAYDTVSQPAAIDISTTVTGHTITANETGATFQWINCNGNVPITDSTNASITPSVTGDYKVAITKNGCTDTSACVHIVIDGIGELVQEDISVYPNPVSEWLVVRGWCSGNTIEVTDIFGRIVLRITDSDKQITKLNVSNFSNGIYSLRMQLSDGNFVVKKFVKN